MRLPPLRPELDVLLFDFAIVDRRSHRAVAGHFGFPERAGIWHRAEEKAEAHQRAVANTGLRAAEHHHQIGQHLRTAGAGERERQLALQARDGRIAQCSSRQRVGGGKVHFQVEANQEERKTT